MIGEVSARDIKELAFDRGRSALHPIAALYIASDLVWVGLHARAVNALVANDVAFLRIFVANK